MKSPAVYLVEDDEDVRDSLRKLFAIESIDVESYASPGELLDAFGCRNDQPSGCFVFDLCLPEMNGLRLYAELLRRRYLLPLVIITGHGEVSDARDAFKLGAIDFLEKPIDRHTLIRLIRQAFVDYADPAKLPGQLSVMSELSNLNELDNHQISDLANHLFKCARMLQHVSGFNDPVKQSGANCCESDVNRVK